MAETQITRCPHCQTTFRIRSEQLAKANGAVRCGSCLQVFKAGENIVSNNLSTKKPAVKIKPEAKPDPISFDDIPDQIADDPLEDFGIRQPDRDTGETFESALKLDDSIFSMQESTKPSRYSLLDNDDNEFSKHFENDNEVVDDSWASSLIDDEETSSSQYNEHDESWADALLDVDDDLLQDIDQGPTKDNQGPKQEADDFVPSLNDDSNNDQFHLGGSNQFDQETVEIELNVTDSVNDLLDEPLSFNTKGKRKQPKVKVASYTLWWFLGSVMMIIAATAQVGYFKFDSWSRHPDYRPAYTFVCELAGCQLPAIQDVSKINTQHFMVRLHPDVEQALYIDTLLVNNADYQQPFPDLNLLFTGLENEVIASRLFKPKEYLAGELAGATVMPLNIPIHIAFEIINPGAEAVSYRIELIANH